MELVNLTNHDVVLDGPDGRVVYRPSGWHPRVVTHPGRIMSGDPPIARPDQHVVNDMPPPAPGTIYIVSSIVGQALRGVRDDCVVPGTNPRDEPVRDERTGYVIAVTRFKWV